MGRRSEFVFRWVGEGAWSLNCTWEIYIVIGYQGVCSVKGKGAGRLLATAISQELLVVFRSLTE